MRSRTRTYQKDTQGDRKPRAKASKPATAAPARRRAPSSGSAGGPGRRTRPASSPRPAAKPRPTHGRPPQGGRPSEPPRGKGAKPKGKFSRAPKRIRPSNKPAAARMKDVDPNAAATKVPPMADDTIRIIPVGGVEEIGKNMTAIEFRGEIIVIDAGIEFTDDDTPGVDYIIPNITYLRERQKDIKALIITHGHLDHFGGIPYVIEALGNPPIYTREFGSMMIKKRDSEFTHLAPLNIKVVEQGDKPIQLTKDLKLTFFGLTHSIPDSTGIIIETPFGDIVNTGDVRVENDDGVIRQSEVEQYSAFKDRNILLLTMDSTGTPVPGFSIPESTVIETVDEIIKNANGRVILGTFASQVERIIEFIKIAKKYGRKVLVEGRSMKGNVEIVRQLGLVELDHVIPIEEAQNVAPEKLFILATGAQGEEFAALMRMANKSHKFVQFNNTDTVILSSSVIPGNENSIQKLKDNIYRHDPKVITYADTQVHASGHGRRGELEWIHTQIPYKFFIPVHGHHYMLKIHREISIAMKGTPETNIVVPDNGAIIDIIEGGKKIIRHKEKILSEDMIVEGMNIGNKQDVVIKDRKTLAEEGMFVIVCSINLKTGKLKKSPDIISRGFVYLRESQDLLQQARIITKKAAEDAVRGMNPVNFDYVKKAIADDVAKFLYQKTAKMPIVIPVVLGV